jgi:hypothetical protein
MKARHRLHPLARRIGRLRAMQLFIGMAALAWACAAEAQRPIVYPAKGQSAQQQSQDDAQCYAWAQQSTGIDPAMASSPPPQQTGPAVGGGQRAGGAAKIRTGSSRKRVSGSGVRKWSTALASRPRERRLLGRRASCRPMCVQTCREFDVGVFRGTGGLRDRTAFADQRIALRSRAVRSGGWGKPTIGRPRTWKATTERAGGLAESGA